MIGRGDGLGVDPGDPFIRRLRQYGLPRPACPWQAEAWRRIMLNGIGAPEAWRQLPTWWWADEMLARVCELPDSAAPGKLPLALHPGVGIGVHVWEPMTAFTVDGNLAQGVVIDAESGCHGVFWAPGPEWYRAHGKHATADRCNGRGWWAVPADAEHLPAYARLTALLESRTENRRRCVDVEAKRPPRQWRRHEPDDWDTPVNVVTWRRVAPAAGAAIGPAPARRRHVVTTHLRNQPYPSEGVTRPIVIAEHERGSGDLVVRPRVNVVKR